MGNWQDDLNRVTTAIRNLDGMPARVCDRIEDDIYTSIQGQFDRGVDAYGEPWEPLAESTTKRGRRPPPLTDTRAMRDSVAVHANGTQLTVSIDDPFPYHQAGTGSMPSRPVLPDRELPAAYAKAVDVAINSYELMELLDAAE